MPKSQHGGGGLLPPAGPLILYLFFYVLVPTGATLDFIPGVLLTNHRAQGEKVMEGVLRVVTVTGPCGRPDIYLGLRERGAIIGSPGAKHRRFV